MDRSLYYKTVITILIVSLILSLIVLEDFTSSERCAPLPKPGDIAKIRVNTFSVAHRDASASESESTRRGSRIDGSSERETSNASRILILAAMRTGSTFLGELFAKREDVFYLFEPGRYIDHNIRDNNRSPAVLVPEYLQLLADVYHCDFSKADVLVNALSATNNIEKRKYAPALLSSKGCYSEANKYKKERLVCYDPLPVSAITEVCKARPSLVIKSIRLPDLNLLLWLIRQARTNLKVIHLVRDPRGMIVSLIPVYWKLSPPEDGLYNASHMSNGVRYYVQQYCYYWVTNIKIGRYVPWVASNYKLVRYEDLAVDPLAYARDVYSFAGMGSSVPLPVQRWLRENTGSNASTTPESPFSSSRNSRETYNRWRKRVRFDFVKAIQNIDDCRELMTLVGYLVVPDEEMLRDLTKSLVIDLP